MQRTFTARASGRRVKVTVRVAEGEPMTTAKPDTPRWRGRPPLGVHAHTVPITFHATREEAQAIRAAALEEGVSVSAFVLRQLHFMKDLT